MNAYLPRNPLTILWVASVLLASLTLGFLLPRLHTASVARLGAWMLVVAGGSAIERLCADESAGVRMLCLIAALLYGMKAVVAVESKLAGEPNLRLGQWLAFAVGWFGMKPELFTALGNPKRPGAGELLWLGLRRSIQGVLLIVAARLVWNRTDRWLTPTEARLAATVLLLPGLSLLLHFGIFNLMAGGWRLAGVDCRPLFRAPLLSRSLTEFWGRRWNLAFVEMTAIGIYRPLASIWNRRVATVVAFLASGLLHELAISVPVQAGYGGPLLYFLIHGGLVLGENRLEQAGYPVHRAAWLGRTWTLFWLALPLPILFHEPFLKGVIWPLLGMEETQ